MKIQDLLHAFLDRLESGDWIIRLFLVVVVIVAINAVIKRVLQQMGKATQRSANVWDDALYFAGNKPLRAITWIVGLSIAVEFVPETPANTLLTYVPTTRHAAVIAVVIWFFLRLVRAVEHNYLHGETPQAEAIDRTTVEAIGKLLRASILITGGLVLMQNFGLSVSGVLAFGGVGGIAIGFAARDLLANFFGGLTIYMDRPFSVGDWIRSPDRDFEGTVEKIGWRSTRIRRFDTRALYVPNSIFTTVAVENPSRMFNRRILSTVGLRYDDFSLLPKIIDDIRAMLKAHEEIDQDRVMAVYFTNYGASSLDMMVLAFANTTDWMTYLRIQEDVFLKIGEIVDQHGASIAFPTRTLHLAEAEKIVGALAGSGAERTSSTGH